MGVDVVPYIPQSEERLTAELHRVYNEGSTARTQTQTLQTQRRGHGLQVAGIFRQVLLRAIILSMKIHAFKNIVTSND